MKKFSRFFLLAAWYIFLLIFFFTASECIARIKNYSPFNYERLDQHEPTMYQPDPVMGWIPKPGKYTVLPYHSSGSEMQYTFLPDGARASSPSPNSRPYDVLFIGCSYTLGWAVSDEETYAWKIQTAFPSYHIGNFAVGGFGTYQSLLRLKQLIDQGIKPKIVVLGFNIFHEERNIAVTSWLRDLAKFSKRSHIAVPYCSLNRQGQLVKHPPKAWPQFHLQEHFAFPQLFIDYYIRHKNGESRRFALRRLITEKLLLELKELTEANNIQLLIALMLFEPEEKHHYVSFLSQNGFNFVDSVIDLSPDLIVPGEVHPNGKAHALWAQKIGAALKPLLESSIPSSQA